LKAENSLIAIFDIRVSGTSSVLSPNGRTKMSPAFYDEMLD